MNRRASKSYNRYFDGYSEYEIITPKSIKIRRVYTGAYHRADLPDSRYLAHKALAGGLYALGILLFGLAGTRPVAANNAWYVMLCTGLSLIALVFVSMSVFTKLAAKRDMIRRVYRSASELLIRRARVAAVILAATGVCVFADIFLAGSGIPLDALLCALEFLAAAAAMGFLFRFEMRTEYVEVENAERAPEDGVEICY